MAQGRKSGYSTAIADVICDRIIAGQTIREICRDPKMPDESTLYRWLPKHEAFREQYARAKELQMERYAEEIIEISDDGTNDWMERRSFGGGGRSDAAGEPEETVPNHEHIARSKLRVDARKWLMSKLAPKKYGDKITQEVTGAEGAPLVPVINVSIGSAKSSPSSQTG